MTTQKKEKSILWVSFAAGLLFAVMEFAFAIYSQSQSALMDAAYDASELIFIILTLFLTPLFYKPISEKRPYGFFQVESIFLIIKGFMMLAVTFSLLANVIQTALTGGKTVNGLQISLFQAALGALSFVVFIVIKHMNKQVSSLTVRAELLGWKIDILYSLGMSVAFFGSVFLKNSPLAVFSPYFDQMITVVIVAITLPENMKMVAGAIRDVFLFSPDPATIDQIKLESQEVLGSYGFLPVFYDITRTGRKLWVAIYFEMAQDSLSMQQLHKAYLQLNQALVAKFENCNCELIPNPGADQETSIE